jgi:hypothetical protein
LNGRRIRRAAALLLVFAGPALPADFDVSVRDIAGKTHSGKLVALNTNQLTLRSDDGKDVAIPLSQLLRIDRRTPPRNRAATAFVYLANGDRLAATATKIDGDDLHVIWNGLPNKPAMKLPLLSVRAILFQRPPARTAFRRLESTLLQHRQQHDLVVLRNGDQVTGRLKALDTENVVMSGSTGKIARSNVQAVAFDPRYVKSPKSTAARFLLRLADGARVSAKTAVLDSDGKLHIPLQAGGELRLPWASVVSLQRVGGNVIPLSSLTPTTFEHTPYLDGKRPLQTDRNVLGGPLALRGREYSIGLGMHSRSIATYAIPANAGQFLATIGIDDDARGEGKAVFVVQLDGKTVSTSPPLTGKDPAVQVGPIPLAGHKRLTLIVEFGQYGDILDYADWCDAMFVEGRRVESRRSKVGTRAESRLRPPTSDL